MKTLYRLVACSLAFSPLSPASASTVTLAPMSTWNVHYDADSCVLRRAFGKKDKFVQLEMRQFAPLATFQVGAYGRGFAIINYVQAYRFSPQKFWQRTRSVHGSFRENYNGVFFPMALVERDFKDLDPLSLRYAQEMTAKDLALAAQVQSVDLRGSGDDKVKLATGPLDKPMQAMSTCLANLVSSWGFDPQEQANLQERPRPLNFPDVAKTIQFPPGMIEQNISGIVNVRLDIAENGAITGCHVQQALSDEAFEQGACAHLQQNLRFDPAINAEGKPTASYFTTTVNYRPY